MAGAADAASVRLQYALNYPIHKRCADVQRIIEESSNKELQNVLPELVQSMFGTGGNSIGWGIRNISRIREARDFDILYNFLSPNGPVFDLCYKLISDVYLKYDFPLSCLPVNIQRMFAEGVYPPFYMSKLQFDHHTRMPTSLTLNPFEYYIFHFAYHLVNPWMQRFPDESWETVYLYLTEDYLRYFLPCDGKAVPPISHGIYKSPVRSTTPLQVPSRSAKKPTLLRSSVVLKQGNSPTSLPTSPQTMMEEIWRSETIIQVFVDFWFSLGERDPGPFNVGTSPQRIPWLRPPRPLNSHPFPLHMGSNQHSSVRLRFFEFLSNGEHIRVVRYLIKHLHYFSNSRLNDLTPMDELKRIILPSSQGKIYGFLRRTIQHWPLDSSFRLILETWLSYIQPWRYTDINAMPRPFSRETEERDRVVGRRWFPFIMDNLLFYTVIFQQLLPRFARLDLCTLKNSQMLFRLTKVFSQINLNDMVREVESYLEESHVPRPSGASIFSTTLPQWGSSQFSVGEGTSSSEHVVGHKYCAMLRQQMLVLEGQGFQYRPMFGPEVTQEILTFLDSIQRGKQSARRLQANLENEQKRRSANILLCLNDMFFGVTTTNDDYTLEERKKVVSYLDTALHQFYEIFQIPMPADFDTTDSLVADNMSAYATPSTSNANASDLTVDSLTHSDASAYSNPEDTLNYMMMTRRQKRVEIRYEGDPDLQPIRTYECALLVRILYQISSKINEMYAVEMWNLYHREDFWGRVARQILSPPAVVSNYDKSIQGSYSPRIQTPLPPRLSLRFFARKAVLLYLCFGFCVCYCWDYSPQAIFFVTLLGYAIFVFVRAVLDPLLKRQERLSMPKRSSVGQLRHSVS